MPLTNVRRFSLISFPMSSVNSATARAPILKARALKYSPPFSSSRAAVSCSAAAIANLSIGDFCERILAILYGMHGGLAQMTAASANKVVLLVYGLRWEGWGEGITRHKPGLFPSFFHR